MKVIGLLVATLISVGCATTRLARPEIADTTHMTVMGRWSQSLPPSLNTPVSERRKVVLDIDRSVNAAAVRVCQRTFSNPEDCPGLLAKRTLVVLPENNGINAFVGGNFDLTVLGGLVAVAGTDAEIASVLAHEYSHALLGHVAKSQTNSALGTLAGLATGVAVASATGTTDPQIATDIITGGTDAGSLFGSLYFSKSMELEADHLGMFILHEAGYDIKQSSNFFRRLIRLQSQREASGQKGMLGFLSTHPTDEMRILNLVATEEMIQQGTQQPNWKPKK